MKKIISVLLFIVGALELAISIEWIFIFFYTDIGNDLFLLIFTPLLGALSIFSWLLLQSNHKKLIIIFPLLAFLGLLFLIFYITILPNLY